MIFYGRRDARLRLLAVFSVIEHILLTPCRMLFPVPNCETKAVGFRRDTLYCILGLGSKTSTLGHKGNKGHKGLKDKVEDSEGSRTVNLWRFCFTECSGHKLSKQEQCPGFSDG